MSPEEIAEALKAPSFDDEAPTVPSLPETIRLDTPWDLWIAIAVFGTVLAWVVWRM
jgi:hypothetical protein